MDLCEIFAKTAEASSQDQEFMHAFSKAVTDSVAGTQAELMSQYTREATETIKNAVGVSVYKTACFSQTLFLHWKGVTEVIVYIKIPVFFSHYNWHQHCMISITVRISKS